MSHHCHLANSKQAGNITNEKAKPERRGTGARAETARPGAPGRESGQCRTASTRAPPRAACGAKKGVAMALSRYVGDRWCATATHTPQGRTTHPNLEHQRSNVGVLEAHVADVELGAQGGNVSAEVKAGHVCQHLCAKRFLRLRPTHPHPIKGRNLQVWGKKRECQR